MLSFYLAESPREDREWRYDPHRYMSHYDFYMLVRLSWYDDAVADADFDSAPSLSPDVPSPWRRTEIDTWEFYRALSGGVG